MIVVLKRKLYSRELRDAYQKEFSELYQKEFGFFSNMKDRVMDIVNPLGSPSMENLRKNEELGALSLKKDDKPKGNSRQKRSNYNKNQIEKDIYKAKSGVGAPIDMNKNNIYLEPNKVPKKPVTIVADNGYKRPVYKSPVNTTTSFTSGSSVSTASVKTPTGYSNLKYNLGGSTVSGTNVVRSVSNHVPTFDYTAGHPAANYSKSVPKFVTSTTTTRPVIYTSNVPKPLSLTPTPAPKVTTPGGGSRVGEVLKGFFKNNKKTLGIGGLAIGGGLALGKAAKSIFTPKTTGTYLKKAWNAASPLAKGGAVAGTIGTGYLAGKALTNDKN